MMKTVKSMYAKSEEIVVLFEFGDRVANITVDSGVITGEVVALGQSCNGIPVFLILDSCDRVVFEITLGEIVKYEKQLEKVKDALGNEGIITKHTVSYFSPEDNFENCHFLSMYDVDPCWD